MRRAALVALMALPLVTITGMGAARPKPKATSVDHDAVVAGRQAAFKLSLASFLGLRAAIGRGDDPKTMVLPATALSAWGKAIPGMFPAVPQPPTSKALKTIWTDRAGFEAAAMTMSAAAASMATLAKAGDGPGAAAQWEVLKASCNACHDKYRAEDAK